MIDKTNGKLQEQLEYAKTITNDSLQKTIDEFERREKMYLEDRKEIMEHSIYNDWAPRSFEFVQMFGERAGMNGGIIFHGPHDGGGNGGAPTFSVSLSSDRSARWEVHT